MPDENVPNHPAATVYLYWWLSPILLLVLGFFCWSNHFQAGFHGDDFPNILNNRSIQNADAGALLTSPAAFSSDSGHADYRPLLALLFALDTSIRQDAKPSVFQITSFLWFLPLPLLLYALARLLPNVKHPAAMLTAMLFVLHPIVSDTLNYISRRGELIAAGALASALIMWVAWPDLLPATLGINRNKIPKLWTERFLFDNRIGLEAGYQRLRRWMKWFYLGPLLFGFLCSPATAAMAPVAAAWLWSFPSQTSGKARFRRLYVAAGACAAWLILHTALTWTWLAPVRVPALQYWLGQPRIVIQYFIWFFAPFNMSADGGMLPQLQFWPPDILLGIIGTAALVLLVRWAGRSENWRPVAFGIGWFLAAQLPFALIPQPVAESAARMFIPSIGLAIAAGYTLIRLIEYAKDSPRFGSSAAFGLSALVFLLVCGMSWMTFVRNGIWLDDRTLWTDTVERSPSNQRALVHYALEMVKVEDLKSAEEYAARADKAAPQDAETEVLVADALDRMGLDTRAEAHYTRAIGLWPRYAAGMSAFGKWLIVRQRFAEAKAWSAKALAVNPLDTTAKVNLIDIYSQTSEWEKMHSLAMEVLKVDPDNGRAKAAMLTSEVGLNRVARALHPSTETTSDDYLTLSVAHFQARRYEDCIRATDDALKVAPDLAEAHANKSVCLHQLGRDDEAILELREVVRLRPDLGLAWSNLRILEQDRRKKQLQGK